MSVYLIFFSLIILLCIFCNKISGKLGIPVLLAFICLGMIFGSDGIFKINFDNYKFAEQICSVALIFIMFYGGFGTNWKSAKPAAAKALALSTLGVVITAALTGLFCYFVLHFKFFESLLFGAVISSTDAASVFSVLRSKELNLKDNTASILEIESGSNDPCSYMLTVIILSVMSGNTQSGKILLTVFTQLVWGAVFGIVFAVIAVFIFHHFKFTAGFDNIFVVAIAILAFALPTSINGNGYLSVYIFGIILGNSSFKNKRNLVIFFDGITSLMQMTIFFLLGLLAFPSQIPSILLPSLAIAVFLTFIARPLAVFALLAPLKCKLNQLLLISWSGLRGAASIVFAIMAIISPAYTKYDIFHIVFCIVLFSIAIQGTLIPFAAKKLNMIDENSNVMKTFNDYTEEVPIQFIQLIIQNDHPWKNLMIKDIPSPPDTLIVLIIRNKQMVVPNGDTVILENDILVMSAQAFKYAEKISLNEIVVNQNHNWLDKTVEELDLMPQKIIVMIQREGKIIIPDGQTSINLNDIIVINELE
ncbi:MAG: potassium/proton antiporter [Ruminococcus sp.]|nr:potassium/proton antiporter [Ruminococcus sp.]